jgi:6-phosphogluconolactonase
LDAELDFATNPTTRAQCPLNLPGFSHHDFLDSSRRLFLKTAVALAATAPLMDGLLEAQPVEAAKPLLAYVGTFSSRLRDVLPTQVDLPPGNGRGIHIFQVSCTTGVMTSAGIHEMGTSPSCLALNCSGTRL